MNKPTNANDQTDISKFNDEITEKELLSNIIENSEDAIISKTLDGIILTWNHGAEIVFGYSYLEIKGKKINLIIPIERLEEENNIISKIRAGQVVKHYETIYKHKNGNLINISVAVSPIHDKDGAIIAISKIARDITEKTSLEMALKFSEHRYYLVLQCLNVGIWDWDIIFNKIFLSTRFKEILKIKEDNIIPNFDEIASLLHPEDKEYTFAKINDHLQNNKPYNIEFRMLRQDGIYVWIHSTGQATWDNDKKPIRMVGAITDVTEHKEIEKKLKEELMFRAESARMLAITNTVLDGLITIDEFGTIQTFNPAAIRIFGYQADEVIGKNVNILMPEPYHKEHDTYLKNYLTTDVKKIIGIGREVSGKRKDGSVFFMELGVNEMRVDGKRMFVGTVRDISERKDAQIEAERRTRELENANKDLEFFAYAASHDLKAPLRVIDNASKWIEDDLQEHMTDEVRQNMNLMRGRVYRMEKLLDDLLEYSRIGKTSDHRFTEIIPGDEIITNILELLSPPPKFKMLISPNFKNINVNRMPLQQILMNLISNSIKHHDKAQGTIEVNVKDMGDHYLFAVKDDGPGIPPQFHAKVFQMFETLNPKDQIEGSGMGLAMVQKNIIIFGGKLTLNSDGIKGSTFEFTWPKEQKIKGYMNDNLNSFDLKANSS